MQFKHLLVALLVLLALVGTAAAADSVEIRSSIIHFDETYEDPAVPGVPLTPYNVTYTTLESGAGDNAWLIDATSWAGLYYDLDDNLKTEKIAIKKNGTDIVDFKYYTEASFKSFDFNKVTPWDTQGFAIIGFFAEPYVALSTIGLTSADVTAGTNMNASKLAKLVLDTNERYTLKTGASLELGEGYSLIVDQIDVDGNKAYLRFLKDGKELNTSIVTTAPVVGGDWFFDLTVLNEKNIQVLRVHVKSVFQGTQDSLVEIEGLWLVDYLNAMEIKSDAEFGKWEDASITKNGMTFYAKEVTLSPDTSTELGRDIYVQTEKNFSATAVDGKDKFYLYKEYTAPGIYEIRSSIVNYAGGLTAAQGTFTYTNFAAFFYDIDSDIQTETLIMKTVSGTNLTVVENSGLVYTTKPEQIGYDYSKTTWTGAKYFIMGFFGEKYVPFNKLANTPEGTALANASKMAKLVIDSNERYTLKTGATLELGEGYTLVVDQIDVDGNKAYIRFMKDGKELNSSIITTDQANPANGGDWVFDLTVLNEKDIQVFRVHVKSVFQGTESSLVEIEGLWLVDYLNAREVKNDDKFGIMKYQSGGSGELKFVLDSEFELQADMDKQIANNMYLKSADNNGLTAGGDPDDANLYFYVNAEIGGDGPVDPQPPVDPSEPTKPSEKPPVVTPTEPDVPDQPDDKEPGWFAQNWKLVVGILVLIIIIAGAAYYFMVYKKQA